MNDQPPETEQQKLQRTLREAEALARARAIEAVKAADDRARLMREQKEAEEPDDQAQS